LNKNKACLLYPIVPYRVLWGKFHKGGGFIPPIGLMSIASYVRGQGFNIEICDTGVLGMDEVSLKKYLKSNDFDVIGIQCFTNTAFYAFKTAKMCREVLPNSIIVIGGVHATVLPKRTLDESPETDIVVIGEGEITFTEILKWKRYGNPAIKNIAGIMYRENGKLIQSLSRSLVNVNEIPMPAYDLLPMELYIPHSTQYKRLPSYPLIASRGCPFSCTFCSASIVHGKSYRFKKIDKLLAEIKFLVKRYNTKGIFFQDSTFTANKSYVMEFCDRLHKEKINIDWMCNARANLVDLELLEAMKKAGCWQVCYGIESANEDTLSLLKKNQTLNQIDQAIKLSREAKLNIMAFYILGLPGEDENKVMNTINFAKKIAAETSIFYLPIPYPGTELIEQCRKDGGLREDARWEDYSAVDFSHPIYINPLLGKEKMIKLYNLANKSYYTSPRVIFNNLRSIRSIEDIVKYWKAFKALTWIWVS